jgi:hypothetical protein
MGQMTTSDSKKNGKSKPRHKVGKKPTQSKRRRTVSKRKSEERRVLEEWEGDEFDTTDYKLLTDQSDSE